MNELDKRSTGHRLSDDEWEEICVLYKSNHTIDEILRRYPISRNGLHNGLRRRGIERGDFITGEEAEIIERIKVREIDESKPFMMNRRNRIEETRRQHYEWSVAIGKLTMQCLMTAKKDNKQFATQANNLKALEIAQSTISKVRAERYNILQADNDIDETALPELAIRDLNAEEIKDLVARGSEEEYEEDEALYEEQNDIIKVNEK